MAAGEQEQGNATPDHRSGDPQTALAGPHQIQRVGEVKPGVLTFCHQGRRRGENVPQARSDDPADQQPDQPVPDQVPILSTPARLAGRQDSRYTARQR